MSGTLLTEENLDNILNTEWILCYLYVSNILCE